MTAESILAVIGTVLAAALGAWALVVTNRQTRQAETENRRADSETDLEAARIKDRETLVTQQREALEQQGEQLERLWARAAQQDARQEALEERAARDHERIAVLERENGDLRQHTITCEAKTDALTARIDDYARRYGVAVRYVRELHDWMAEHLPGDLKPPNPPEGLAFDLADPMHASSDPPPPGWPPRAAAPGRTVGP